MATEERQLELGMPGRVGLRDQLYQWLNGQSYQLYDRQLLWLALVLLGIGVVMVASASIPVAATQGEPLGLLQRHLIYLVLGLVAATVVMMVPLARWEAWNGWLCLLAVVLLVMVLMFGHTVNGATRWLRIGPFSLQVAELAKLFFIVFLASYLHRRHHEVRKNWRGFFKALIVLAAITGLLMGQPDLGTTVVIASTAILMLFIAGARLAQFFALAVCLLATFVVLVITAPYRMQRVTSFMNPWEDPFGAGYQLTQSLMAFGRGDLSGQGLGNSVQKLQFLPEAHTDFILAVLAEELGFVGVALVLGLVLLLVLKALWLGQRALRKKRPFSGYLAHGIGIWFGLQALVNGGAAAGLIPTKGLTLPLISYGGTSLLVMCVAVAVLLRIDYEVRTGYREGPAPKQPPGRRPAKVRA